MSDASYQVWLKKVASDLMAMLLAPDQSFFIVERSGKQTD